MTKKLCTYPGCNAVVDHPDDGTSPRCEKHQRNYTQETRRDYTHALDEHGNNIYQTPRWRALSRRKRTQDPLCEKCLENDIAVPAKHADHIVEIEDGGEMWDINNLQSLCISCHNRKTAKERQRRNKKNKTYKSLSDY